MKKICILLFTMFVPLFTLYAQDVSIGIFEIQALVGEPENEGIASFSENDGVYVVDAVGDSIGDDTFVDQFLFVFKEMEGSFALEAEPFPAGTVGLGGVMVRQS